MNKELFGHKKATRRMQYVIASKGGKEKDPWELGMELVELGLDKATDGFWIHNLTSGKSYYSPKYLESFGYSQEANYPGWEAHIEKDSLDRALELFKRHIDSHGQVPYEIEVTYDHSDGTKVKLTCSGDIVSEKGKELIVLGSHKIMT